ncbi:MAG TPA: sugar ABC transporter ATP-binding protein [Verrucomicrobiae bacterium]|nr:sugar ABC transporter ATP-binding protein [Verrucomicrobiae bacterium]
MNGQPLLDIRRISKAFGGVQALRDVSLSIAPGEVHALCGENGAGKSTLINIVSGSVLPDDGDVLLNGTPLPSGDVRAAEAAGIAVIHQESTAFLHLDAEDNIFVGREPRRGLGLLLDHAGMRSQTRGLLERLGEHFDQRTPLAELTVAQRQMVGIARALSQSCRLLIMDEPTASLSAREIEVLFRIVRQLRSEGISILYVSHRLEEVFELSDRVSVLRDGRWVDSRPTRELTRQTLIQKMVGREVGDLFTNKSSSPPVGDVLLDVRKLTRAGVFQDVSFSVRSGEIVGLAGLIGAGRSEVAQAIFGIDPYDSGDVAIAGNPLARGSARAALRAGVALVPEDRQHLGLILPMAVGVNLSMVVLSSLTHSGLISRQRETDLVERLIRQMSIKTADAGASTQTLSGGNQQKVMLGKWLAPKPRVLLLDEPTRGVDVGAKAEVHGLIRQLASQGMATLLISSDLPELLMMSDRIVVMRSGSISGELSRAEATQERVLEMALPRG